MTRLLAATAILIATQAQAQTRCGPHAVILKMLVEKYGEQRRVVATNPNMALEFFANEETGTWTILTTDARGMTCLRMGGDSVVFEPAVVPGEPT